MANNPTEIKVIKCECSASLHRKFKEKCRVKDTKMNTELIRMVKQYINATD
jgi:hypothetical protein